MKFPDDQWREILEANGFTPSGAREEVWRSPYSDVVVKIDVNRETEEPYYQIVGEDSELSDTDALKHLTAPKEVEPQQLSPEEAKMKDDELLKSMGIKAGSVRYESKLAGRPPRFSFSVPMNAAGHVAFQLTKAGMKDFEVTHFKEDEISSFEFSSEPEMHVAEEIVKAEFVDQIEARKGQWAMWNEVSDPTQIKGERELEQPKQYVSSQHEVFAAREQGKIAGQWGDRSYDSDQVHDILDEHRRFDGENTNISFDDPVPQENVEETISHAEDTDEQVYLGVIVFLVTHGADVPQVYRSRARQIAFALVQDEAYLAEWQDPQLRKVELENEIELLEGGVKTAAAGERYRRKKLGAWVHMLGLDLSAELKRYDEGDYYAKDQVYDEVRDMVKEERKFQSHYRRPPRQ